MRIFNLLLAAAGLPLAVNALAEFEGYVFAYFTGNSLAGENIFLAASQGNDALNWFQLNGGNPILTSTNGTRGLRDPFLIRSQDGDKFFLIATDLSIGSGTSWGDAVRRGSLYLEIWESEDLITWSEQRHVKVSPPAAGNTWAPEAYWDDDLNAYLVFWASSLYAEDDPNHNGNSYHRMLSSVTRDFITFSPPVVWQDAGLSRIDTTVLKDGDTYYRFTKDEGAFATGCSDIIQESSGNLTAGVEDWTTVATCIGRNAGLKAVEGPTAIKANPRDVRGGGTFYLFVDEYGGRGYLPLATADIAHPTWKVPSQYNLPKSPRHGTVLPVTGEELSRLRSSTLGGGGQSPLEGFYADPNVAVFEGDCKYYIYSTTDGYPGWGGKSFYVWSSYDLVNWTRTDEPFLTLDGGNGNVPWATGNAWAPTIIERGGKYYFYFSGHNPQTNRKNLGVAVGDSPTGPFRAQSQPLVLNSEAVTSGQAIDPAAFRDPVSGEYYLYWGNGRPVFAKLNEDMISLDWSSAAVMSGLTDYREGTFVVYREGIYHATYSVDDTGSVNYRVGYATATSPQGPWTYRGVILEKDTAQGILGTGHNSILNIPGSDEWYIVYHRFGIPGGDGTHREVGIDKLTFGADGFMQKVQPTLGGVEERFLPHCECKAKRS